MADYRAVVLPFASDADLEALDISDSGYIIGMMSPTTNEYTPKPILWWPEPDGPPEYGSQVFRMASPAGGAPFTDGVAVSIDTTTNDIVGYLWQGLAPASQHAFYQTGHTSSSSGIQAILWEDLTPGGAEGAIATAADGGKVAGAIRSRRTGRTEAALWDGNPISVTAGHFANLHPIDWNHSLVEDTNGVLQVGRGGEQADDDVALLWEGPGLVTLLHPYGYLASSAEAIDGHSNRIAGWAEVPDGAGRTRSHAIIWNAIGGVFSASRHTDLHPRDLVDSAATGVAPGVVAGWANGERTGGEDRAMYWPAGPGSEFDLHQFLPPEYVSSASTAVNSQGIIVGTAVTEAGEHSAIVWMPSTDFFISHDSPVLYVSNTNVVATGSVMFENAERFDRMVEVAAGTATQRIVVPAGQAEGRFRLSLRLSSLKSRFATSFRATHNGDSRTATLTLIPRSLMAQRRP
jgi:hypothetical protein